MTGPTSSALVDFSITLPSGASTALFPAKSYGDVVERFVHNPNAAGDLWINPFGNAAVANGAGAVRIQPGETFAISNTNAINVIGANGAAVTAGSR